ncbi:MAG TPA: hypothetical protein VGO56_13875 [Pyrinomonadaceae bacterium]|jgi:hypothetical protein|nr:hypothetical protein [Pyrinomonadaceae bacterium]
MNLNRLAWMLLGSLKQSRFPIQITRLSVVLLLAPIWVSAQVGFSPFRTDFPPEEFAARRAKVFESPGATAIAVVQGAPIIPSAAVVGALQILALNFGPVFQQPARQP